MENCNNSTYTNRMNLTLSTHPLDVCVFAVYAIELGSTIFLAQFISQMEIELLFLVNELNFSQTKQTKAIVNLLAKERQK